MSTRMAVILVVAVLLLAGTSASAQTLLYPGDIVFLGYQTDDPDAFAFMLLTDVSTGTQINFTDNGWNGNTGEFNTNEGTTVWTASTSYPRGTIVRYDDGAGGEFSGSLQGLSTVGDQVIAFQGSALEPFFVAGIASNDRWVISGPDPTSSYSFVPPTLELGLNVRGFQSEIDNGYYDPVGKVADGAIDTGTPLDFLLAVNDSSLTWTRTSTFTGFEFPAWNLTLLPAPTIVVEYASHILDFGAVVSNTNSPEVVLSVSGFGLGDDLTIDAPAGFEVSQTSGSGFGSSVVLAEAGGVVSATNVYVRFSPTAVQTYEDSLFVSSAGASTRDLILKGEGALALGLTQATPSNGAGALGGSDIFERAQAGQTLQLDMVGVSAGTVAKVRVTLPAGWSALSAGNVSFTGSAFSAASAAVVGQQLEVTGATLTDVNIGAIVIGGLTAPDPTALTDDGVSQVQVDVAGSAGGYLALVTQPVVYVTIPIQNIRDYAGDFLPLDEGDMVAIDGVSLVDSGVLSNNSLQVYLQDATGGMYVNYIGELFPVVEGNRYIAKGVVGHFGGNFRVVPQGTLADNIFDLGASSVPGANVLTIAQILVDPESLEGTLVRVDNVEIISGTWGPDETLVMTDDSGVSTINLRVEADTNVDEMNEPTGTFGVIGILYQFDSTAPHNSGYRVLPRSQFDFIGVTGVDDLGGALPARIALLPSSPNPFRARTALSFELPEAAEVRLAIFDLQGRQVRALLNGEVQPAGRYTLPFNGLSDAGTALASGIYFVRFQAGEQVYLDRLTLVK